MAKLTTKQRKAIPSKDFALPEQRKFPIEDASHARNALSRASAQGGSVEAEVRRKVHAKYPGIGKPKVKGHTGFRSIQAAIDRKKN